VTAIRGQSCSACPYRRDVPSGVWAAHEYDKLVQYDAPTGAQPLAGFACHATPEFLCHGWAMVHENRGHGNELLALRACQPENYAITHEPDPSLFDSGQEAADHGKRDIAVPPGDARADRLLRKYDRLQK
jgi:hypothetical protein